MTRTDLRALLAETAEPHTFDTDECVTRECKCAPTEDVREALARAVFIASDDFAFADRMAKAWDAPGPHGRARWYNYADAILTRFHVTPKEEQ